jgi:hypothetical protein
VGDHIDASNNYDLDYQRLRSSASPSYRDKVYGRVIHTASGFTILQYWFFYYRNPKNYPGGGEHEGDWEMAQVWLDSSYRPTGADYAQHNGGEGCSWDKVQVTPYGRPIVYVARGSHASYFNPGFKATNLDYAYGDSSESGENLSLVDITTFPKWVFWPGVWGGSGNSPPSPGRQGAPWDTPENPGFASCTVGVVAKHNGRRSLQGRKESHERIRGPRGPRLSAHRNRRYAIVRYSLPDWLFRRASSTRRSMLITTDSAGHRYPPITKQYAVRGRSGRVRQWLGIGRPPYTVRASVIGPNGRRSTVRAIRIR